VLTKVLGATDIAGRVRRDILSGRYSNGQVLTQDALAKELGISRLMVNRALAELRAEGVLVGNRRAGTVVHLQNRGFGSSDGLHTLLLTAPVYHPFFPGFFENLEERAFANGTLILLTNQARRQDQEDCGLSDASLFGHLQDSGVRDAVIWPFHGGADDERLLRLRGVGWNIVLFDHFSTGGSADCVGLDNHQAIADLVGSLRHEGCRNIHYFGWHRTSVPLASTEERARAFEACSGGLSTRNYLLQRYQGQYRSEVHRVVQGLRGEQSLPDAFVCVNGEVAEALFQALGSGTVMPYVAVVDEVRTDSDRVLSIRQPVERMATAVLDCLLAQRKRGEGWKAEALRFRGTLVRGSAGDPAATTVR